MQIKTPPPGWVVTTGTPGFATCAEAFLNIEPAAKQRMDRTVALEDGVLVQGVYP